MKRSKRTKRIELDTEVVADLEADDAETEAVRGGGWSGSRAERSSGVASVGTGTGT